MSQDAALVEVLAKAFVQVQPGVYGEDWPRDDPDEFQFLNPREHAEAIAAALDTPETKKVLWEWAGGTWSGNITTGYATGRAK